MQTKRSAFARIAELKGVAGVIDCTYVRIVAPKNFEAEYVKRKKIHSTNV